MMLIMNGYDEWCSDEGVTCCQCERQSRVWHWLRRWLLIQITEQSRPHYITHLHYNCTHIITQYHTHTLQLYSYNHTISHYCIVFVPDIDYWGDYRTITTTLYHILSYHVIHALNTSQKTTFHHIFLKNHIHLISHIIHKLQEQSRSHYQT